MLRTLAALVCSLLLCGTAAALVGEAEQASPYFVNRTLQVFVQKSICSAVVVGPQLVMTAAHCLAGAKSVKVGLSNAVATEAARFASHPEYKHSGATVKDVRADIGLIKSEKSLDASLLPAVVATRPVRMGESLTVVGYGLQDNGKRDGKARMATFSVTESFDNEFALGDPASFGAHVRRGACNGDSGAPVFSMQGGGLFLVGIVSATDYCGGLTFVTSLAPLRKWIEGTAQQWDAQLGP
jgi:secreted trypsin-like serine protease